MIYNLWDWFVFGVAITLAWALIFVSVTAIMAPHTPAFAYVGNGNCVYQSVQWDEDTKVGCYTTTQEAHTVATLLSAKK